MAPAPHDLSSPSQVTEPVKRFLDASKKNSLMLLWAFMVGSLAGFVGIMFQLLVVAIGQWKTTVFDWGSPLTGQSWVMPTVFSAVLTYIAVLLVRTFAPEAGGSGVQEIEGALDDLRPVRWKRVLPVKFIGGICSLSSGLVLGREGPTVQMGGNLGQMIGEWFRTSKDEVHVLIAAGAGAGLSAAFNAPLAGVLFVIEEMRPQFSYNFLSVQSVLIATSMANIVALSFTGQAPVIDMSILSVPPLPSLWLFVIFGALFGFFGVAFNFLLLGTLNIFSDMRGGLRNLAVLSIGAIIGFLGWLSPDTTGGGYEVMPRALHSSLPIMTLLILFVVRYGTTMVSYGSGAPGGIFAPMLALGTLFGMWFGHFAHAWFPHLIAHPAIFAVAGMCALFSATVRAPLTGIALTIEMTGNYSLILPLILTCLAATLVAQGLGGKPIYTVLLQRTLALAKNGTVTLSTHSRTRGEIYEGGRPR